ncbi:MULTISPECIES: enolase C-terminal domain-like protein [Streptomycetaceae]|uniref:Putative muconate cyclo-isomerase/lactamase n=1 Tax=Streptantibioticus cattleyicolor (strain ATCC 35852 / DSM 46488 / JCM 4925 / NBRC 14057 / NRRL 8057) TaxID=1003195 RepID=F8JQU7_STREN|nr:enolase C-terminal domain-like protein [Streptantibioticus cattleyicolor]AEW92829.1 putative muconate cyclo-isomerase/lactamase [Streptantibioticus cattleyicolor NRRL 8057 = DSM 46488]MYS57588.1 muconate cycloisomerase [Streptomyces sp. SID5468]CCB73183.1 putative muconate cyclo-isomerase/lactamase [Streptantibioticus cattleyicolor NRRL 8057 = DSM 46488]
MTAAPRVTAVHTATVPMRRAFAHARHSHTTTASVLVTVELNGVEGWGEGAPRPYVTGETPESVVRRLRAFDPGRLARLLPTGDFDAAIDALAAVDLPRLLGGARPAPAAAAALETALLDAVCRIHGRSFSDVLDACPWAAPVLTPAPRPRPVSEVVDTSRTPEEQLGALPPEVRSRLRHVKLKALPSPRETAEHARQIRHLLGPGVRISVDANGGWSPRDAEEGACLLSHSAAVDWLEEPTAPRDWTTLRRVQDGGMPVMLDESAVDAADITRAAATGAASLINIRVSKCGGLLPSLRLARLAHQEGLRVQLGVQVGEIGPLWSAGRTLAARLADLVAVECGRQDEWFPQPLTEPAYSVDREHHLAPPPPGPGHGLRPAAALLPHLHDTPAARPQPQPGR